MHTRLDSFLRNWKAVSDKFKMSQQEHLSIIRGLRHILKGVEKNGDPLEVSAGQMIIDLDLYLKKN